jgi:hypothetical protein
MEMKIGRILATLLVSACVRMPQTAVDCSARQKYVVHTIERHWEQWTPTTISREFPAFQSTQSQANGSLQLLTFGDGSGSEPCGCSVAALFAPSSRASGGWHLVQVTVMNTERSFDMASQSATDIVSELAPERILRALSTLTETQLPFALTDSRYNAGTREVRDYSLKIWSRPSCFGWQYQETRQRPDE